MKKIWKVLKIYFFAAGVAVTFFCVWLAAGLPFYFDRCLVVNEKAGPAEFIICPTGGVSADSLPSDTGWRRIYTAVQLYFDGFGKKIVFTGGMNGNLTEAEVYAEAAGWLGCPEEAMAFEARSARTADHPKRLLEAAELQITRETPLNIVTSDFHSRRVSLCFKKAGYRNFRMITRYVARKSGPKVARQLRVSRFAADQPSGRAHDDVLTRLRTRTSYFFTVLREMAGIVVYKIKGYI